MAQKVFCTNRLRKTVPELTELDNDMLYPTMRSLYHEFMKKAHSLEGVTDYRNYDNTQHILVVEGKIVEAYWDMATSSPLMGVLPGRKPNPMGIFLEGERSRVKKIEKALEQYVKDQKLTVEQVKKTRRKKFVRRKK